MVQAVRKKTDASVENTSGPTRPSRSPPQPMFNGSDFNTFLKRYRRWLKLSGMESLDEETNRAWFLNSMEANVIEVVEAIYERTTTLEALLQQVAVVFPTYTTDLTLRAEISKLPVLVKNPEMEDCELLIVKLDTL